MNKKLLRNLRRSVLVLAGSVLMALNIVTFVRAGALLPGGFNGLALLIQDLFLHLGGFTIPFTPILFILNAVPAAICFKFVGKKFTLYSVLVLFISGLLVDWLPLIMPAALLNYLSLKDPLLCAVFGGFLNAFATSLCLYADASSGGTDFIAIFISEKYRKESWFIIFFVNSVILTLAGIFFSLEMVLYSIIFQFTNAMAMGVLYLKYQQRTLLIITSEPDEVHLLITAMTGYGATYFEGHRIDENKRRIMLYSVVTANQVKSLIPAIKKLDPKAFINVLRTEQINGKFDYAIKD